MPWFIALCIALATAAPAETVRIGTEGAYPPYNFVDRGGTLRGFDIDVGTAICAEAELTCEWVIHPWSTIIPGLLKGQFDAIMAGMAATPKRAEKIAFSEGYEIGSSGAMFLSRHDTQLSDPATALVAVQTQTIHLDYLSDRGIRYVAYATPDELIEAVWAGSADMALGSISHFEQAIQHAGGVLKEVTTVEIETGDTIVGLRKEDVKLKQKIDAAIISLMADGTIDRLSEKWFSEGAGTY